MKNTTIILITIAVGGLIIGLYFFLRARKKKNLKESFDLPLPVDVATKSATALRRASEQKIEIDGKVATGGLKEFKEALDKKSIARYLGWDNWLRSLNEAEKERWFGNLSPADLLISADQVKANIITYQIIQNIVENEMQVDTSFRREFIDKLYAEYLIQLRIS